MSMMLPGAWRTIYGESFKPHNPHKNYKVPLINRNLHQQPLLPTKILDRQSQYLSAFRDPQILNPELARIQKRKNKTESAQDFERKKMNGAPMQKITTYKANYLIHKGANQYIPFVEKLTRGAFPFLSTTSYKRDYRSHAQSKHMSERSIRSESEVKRKLIEQSQKTKNRSERTNCYQFLPRSEYNRQFVDLRKKE